MLHLHRAERADGLVAALGALLADPPRDPFAPEVVAVPTRGVERWLAQRLSLVLGATPGRADGVAANVDFRAPRVLVEDALSAATGLAPDDDPWRGEKPVWPLLEVVDEHLEAPWLQPLAHHLDGSGPDGVRRFSTVRHVAGLFARYAAERPELLLRWAAGEDAGDWQAELWRRLRARLGGGDTPAERLGSACARLVDEPGLLELPDRLALFGLTRLPAAQLQILRAVAARRDVHLMLLHPSPLLWRAVAEATAAGPRVVRRAGDPTAPLARHPLLASWGRDARELQLVLGQDEHADHHHAEDGVAAATLLQRLQAGVREDVAPPRDAAERAPLDPGDRSVRVHACHGRARQVEVLRDELLHLLREDPTLEPRDVVVMCPDIEAFAPLVHATFGALDGPEDDEDAADLPPELRPVDLRVRLADRALRQTNPVLGVVARLLELADARLTVSEVLELADREPVRRRFALDDDDLARLAEWAAQSGVRWGLDAPHRAPFRLDTLRAGTWRAGLDRLLLGVAMPGDEAGLWHDVLPLEDVESGAIELAGRVGELVDRLDVAFAGLRGRRPVAAWAAAVERAADLLTRAPGDEPWQRTALSRLLEDAVADAGEAEGTVLSLAEVRALLADRLKGRPTRANFRTGQLTVCTLVPMRSVPHRVVCLLGLDDGAFPRKAPRDGDDLLLRDPHVGDRDPRAEDRQQLLDALMAARETLLVTYAGRDERTNAALPPAVPVGELLDAVDRTVAGPGGRPARETVLVEHPLQPFDPRNFTAGVLGRPEAASFDRVLLGGARALAGPRTAIPPFLAEPLPPVAGRTLELDELVRFAEAPVRSFLRARLDVGTGERDDEPEDALPVELDQLERYGVGQRLLDALLAGVDRRDAYRAEIARGTLPPQMLGKPVVDEILPTAERIAEAAGLDGPAPASRDVRVLLPDGREVRGTVPGVCGSELRRVAYARISPRHRLAAWVRLLALTASDPEPVWSSLLVGRDGSEAAVRRVPPLGATPQEREATARRWLLVLADLHDRGMREPPPLATKTSAAWAQAVAHGLDPREAAEREWTSGFGFPKEDADPEQRLVHGGVVGLDALLEARPREDEAGDAWEATQPTRFGRWAVRLWAGPLEHEA